MQKPTSQTLPDFSKDFVSVADFLAWWLCHPVLDADSADVLNTYYQSYRNSFGAYTRHHYCDQMREINALISSRQRPNLLEVGAGCGTEALWFALRGARVLAIDINEQRLNVARARQQIVENAIGRPLDLEFRSGSLFELTGKNVFDLVWMEQSFHHVEPRHQVYPTIARLLAPEGHVVISEANGWNPLLHLVLFGRRGFRTVVDRMTADGQRLIYGNERITVPAALVRGFSISGIEVGSVRYFRTLPNTKLANALMPLEARIPQSAKPLFSHYNYVGRKKSPSDQRSRQL